MGTNVTLLKSALAIFFLGILFCSCSTPRYVYAPPAQNIPVLTQKGDSKIAGYYSINSGGSNNKSQDTYKDKANGLDLQAAYAITNKFALQASFVGRKEKTQGSRSTTSYPGAVLDYKRHTYEFAMGYYTVLNVKKSIIFQVFAGFGSGRFQFTDNGFLDVNTSYSRFHDAGISKYFLQPACIFYNHGFSVAVASRFTLIKYHNIKTNYTAAELNSYNLEGLSNDAFLLWEPAVSLAYQLKHHDGIRFEMQFGFARLTNNLYYDIRNVNFSIGAAFDITKKIF